jgi:hypothetical protein
MYIAALPVSVNLKKGKGLIMRKIKCKFMVEIKEEM